MNWQNEAIEDLKKYPFMKESLLNIQERIAALKANYTAVKSATVDTIPVKCGSCKTDDRLINNIVERQRLECTYKATKKIVELIGNGLDSLDNNEKIVLEKFYINRKSGFLQELMEELNYEQRRIYQIKDKALYKFTISMYGIADY